MRDACSLKPPDEEEGVQGWCSCKERVLLGARTTFSWLSWWLWLVAVGAHERNQCLLSTRVGAGKAGKADKLVNSEYRTFTHIVDDYYCI
jgi:hypothetical protein